MNISYHHHRSHRRSISIRILPNWEIKVSAPYGISEHIIEQFVQSKQNRIKKQLDKFSSWDFPSYKTVTKELKEKALIQILPRVEYYAKCMNVETKYKHIWITAAKTKRWSCSNTWKLLFHRRLSELPLFVLDYVIVHELAHLVHFNHSTSFWSLVEEYYPDYKHTKKWLKENGHSRSIT